MNHLKLLSRSSLAGLVLITGSTLGLLVACSSDDNAAPGTPVINTGGGGGKNADAGAPNGDSGTPDQGGTTNSNGGGTPTGDAGEAGQGGAAGGAGEPSGGTGGTGGSGGAPVTCPTTDLGFLNQTTTSQKSAFDNVKRLGTYTTLPALQ